MDQLQTSTWRDLEDIQEDINRFLRCDNVNCHIEKECIFIAYNPDEMPSNRDIIGLIQYVLWDLGGMVVFDNYNNIVRVRFRVKTG